jgi:hypothetical protein
MFFTSKDKQICFLFIHQKKVEKSFRLHHLLEFEIGLLQISAKAHLRAPHKTDICYQKIPIKLNLMINLSIEILAYITPDPPTSPINII